MWPGADGVLRVCYLSNPVLVPAPITWDAEYKARPGGTGIGMEVKFLQAYKQVQALDSQALSLKEAWGVGTIVMGNQVWKFKNQRCKAEATLLP